MATTRTNILSKASVLSSLLFLPLFLCGATPNVTIKGTIDPALGMEGKWAYLLTHWGNERDMPDSCLIVDGKFSLDSNIDEVMFAELLLPGARNGSSNLWYRFVITPGDNSIVNIDAETWKFLNPENSPGSRNYYEIQRKDRGLANQRKAIQAGLARIGDPESQEYKILADSLDRHIYYMFHGNLMESFNYADNPISATHTLMIIGDFAPEYNIDSLTQVLKKRFPNNREVQIFGERTPPPSEHSRQVEKRLMQLQGISLQTPAQPKVKQNPTDGVVAYKLGDKIERLSVPSTDEVKDPLKEITTDYILIDFWAAWCTPCLAEAPNVKKVHNDYKSQLTILAISLDQTETQWKQAIEKHELQQFAHLMLDPQNPDKNIFTASFGIKFIPANFLLDKERRIVAVDLRGETLGAKMEELAGKK